MLDLSVVTRRATRRVFGEKRTKEARPGWGVGLRSLAFVLVGATIAAGLATGCAFSQAQLQVEIPVEHHDADLFVDGHYVGVLGELRPQEAGLVRLAPGEHRVEVRKPGYFPYQNLVEVPRRKTPCFVSVKAQLLADPG